MKKLAILASGSGTNAENIYKFFSNGNRITTDIVIYDRASAGVAERMKALGVETLYIPASEWNENPQSIADLLKSRGIDLVVLAGFLRIIPPQLTEAFPRRIINIHPSLLPNYGGMGMYGEKVHQAVISAGEKQSGVTVHYVSDEVDAGEILMQESVEIGPDETPESLEQKIHKIEYSLYPRAIVAALRNISEAETSAIPVQSSSPTPPPMPSPAEEWADTLGVRYDENILQSPPPTPGETTPDKNTGRPTSSSSENGNELPPMPSNYLVWSVIMTVVCCLPAGIAAIIFSSQVNSKYYAGDYEGARKASERAQLWIIISFVIGVIANTLYLPIMLIAA